ncbi:sensor histidine kinase [Streptococcus castoreus]|uniref:sensor histidine kinase n=1 Tax=Streptococcus castoreus TaxID=254786 RepID=UPI000415996D|nr:sensor histidine kinase [Streptococcus castoreus]
MGIKSWRDLLPHQLKQGILINRLMKLYSFLILIFFVLGAIGLSGYTISNTYRKVDTEAQMRLEDVLVKLQSQNDITLRVVEQLFGQPEDYTNFYQYMTLSPSQYFTKLFQDWEKGKNNILFSEQLRRLFDLYPSIKALTISLDDSGAYLYADKVIKTGRLMSGSITLSQGNYLVRSIRNPETGDVTGKLYLTFEIPTAPSPQKQTDYLATYAFDYYGRKLFNQGGKGFLNLETGLMRALKTDKPINGMTWSKGYQIRYSHSGDLLAYVAIKKSYFFVESVRIILLYSSISFLLAWLLLLILFRVFKNYIQQVSEITNTVERVAAGDLSLTIDNHNMELELYHISEAINQMLGNINTYIEEIYILEVEQRDAQMKALQSQINPHFLYNTLEYIRMSAISCQQEELADVIYAFASLLRNNISQDKMTKLKDELDFCDKYIYLYQMRYPNSFAYHVKMDASVADLEIPKFIIQPLVENYFRHGIDYSRRDNALSIKALDEGDSILIQVLDNGKGISLEDLMTLEENLKKPQMLGNTSIGLQNVYMRLNHYFSKNVSWLMSQSPSGGFMIRIQIRKEI